MIILKRANLSWVCITHYNYIVEIESVFVAWSESISDQAIWVYIGRVSRGVDVSIEVGQPPL